MADLVLELRRWLGSLDEPDLQVIVSFSDPLRHGARLPARGRKSQFSSKRETRAARMWITKAPANRLTAIAESALPLATKLLKEHHNFDPTVVQDPDLSQLTEMLSALGRPLNQLILYGLLLGDAPASELASCHRDELWTATELSVRQAVPQQMLTSERATRPESSKVAQLDVNMREGVQLASEDVGEDDLDRAEAALAAVLDNRSAIRAVLRASVDRLDQLGWVTQDLREVVERHVELNRNSLPVSPR